MTKKQKDLTGNIIPEDKLKEIEYSLTSKHLNKPISTKDKRVMLEKAKFLIEQGMYQESLYYLENITDLELSSSEVFHYIGLAHYRLGNEQFALEYFNKAMRDSVYPPSLIGIAQIFADKGQFNEALKILNYISAYEGSEMEWAIALIHKARIRAIQGYREKTLRNLIEAMRIVSYFLKYSKEPQIDKIVNLVEKTHEFDIYRDLTEFKEIFLFDWNQEHEKIVRPKMQAFTKLNHLEYEQLDQDHLDIISYLCLNSSKSTCNSFEISYLDKEVYLNNYDNSVILCKFGFYVYRELLDLWNYGVGVEDFHQIEIKIDQNKNWSVISGIKYENKAIDIALDILGAGCINVRIPKRHGYLVFHNINSGYIVLVAPLKWE